SRAKLFQSGALELCLHAAIAEVEGVRMPLGDKADHSAHFSFEPAKIGVFIAVKRAAKLMWRKPPTWASHQPVRLVRHDFAAASSALSSLSVSAPRKPRTRRNDCRKNRSAAE